jgi:hypothetical protein
MYKLHNAAKLNHRLAVFTYTNFLPRGFKRALALVCFLLCY